MKPGLILQLSFILSYSLLQGQNDLSLPFKECGLEGSVTLYDYTANKWISNDIHDAHSQTLPASTFKIIHTLIALETGVISSVNETIKWPGYVDSTIYGYRPDIYRDMKVREAFKLSAVWVYIELSKLIGKENYAKYLKACNYGNVDLSTDGDFWNFGNLAISPANQIELLLDLYKETLPFKKDYQQMLKGMMIEEETESYTLRAKTGWTSDDGEDIGWWVGYIEKNEDVYFFATRLRKNNEIPNPEFGACRKSITKNILKQLKIRN